MAASNAVDGGFVASLAKPGGDITDVSNQREEARYFATDCYDLTCTLKKGLGIGSDVEAQGLLSAIMVAVLVLATLAPFLPRLLRSRK